MKHKAQPQIQTLLKNKTIGFIGAGNMAQAIIHGLIRGGVEPPQLACSNPSPEKLESLKRQYPQIVTSHDNQTIAAMADILVLAVKPQKIALALEPLVPIDLSNKLVVSVAAGVETQTIEQLLKQKVAQVRAMPNTPATIGLAATGLFANDLTTKTQQQITESIFNSIGLAIWIEDESQMDLVTAISGSGPAHYFLFLEAVCQSAIEQGMAPEVAKKLAVQTALGAASMVRQNFEQAIAELRKQVTSPAGTTAAAIESMQQDQFAAIIDKAIRASVKRGKELAQASKIK